MVEVLGRAGKRRVRLEVDDGRIRWLSRTDEVQKEPEIVDVPHATLTALSIVTTRPGYTFVGVVMVGFALLARLADPTYPLPVWGGIGLLGAALIFVDVTSTTTTLKAVSPEVTLMLLVDRRSRKALLQLEDLVLKARPGLARLQTKTLSGLLSDEVLATVATRETLEREYRRSAGEKATPENEARYPGQRRKLALWTLCWLALFPLGGTLLSLALLPTELSLWILVRTLLMLVGLFFAGGVLQRSLTPLLGKWLKG